MAHPQHEEVRQRYEFRCGYCGVSETDVGGQLTVDHYHPLAAGGSDTSENLVYACFRCNQYKSDFWPTAAEIEKGLRILHPLLDNIALHIREDPEAGFLIHLTDTGRTHIEILQLNRPELVEHRRAKRRWAQMERRIQFLEVANRDLQATINLLRQYISLLESEISESQ